MSSNPTATDNPDRRPKVAAATIYIVLAAIFVLLIAGCLVVASHHHHELPDFSLTRFDVSSFNSSSNFSLSFAVRNPSSEARITYGTIFASLFHVGDLISGTTLFPPGQGWQDVTEIKATFATVGWRLEKGSFAEFGVTVCSAVRFSSEYPRYHYWLKVSCEAIGVGFKHAVETTAAAARVVGSMLGPARECRVDVE